MYQIKELIFRSNYYLGSLESFWVFLFKVFLQRLYAPDFCSIVFNGFEFNLGFASGHYCTEQVKGALQQQPVHCTE